MQNISYFDEQAEWKLSFSGIQEERFEAVNEWVVEIIFRQLASIGRLRVTNHISTDSNALRTTLFLREKKFAYVERPHAQPVFKRGEGGKLSDRRTRTPVERSDRWE